MDRRYWGLLVLFLLSAVSAFADNITYNINYTCTAAMATNFAADCSALTATIAPTYQAIFSNADASILVDQSSSIGSDVADNTQAYNSVSYSSYWLALQKGATDDATHTTAFNSLSANNCSGKTQNCVNPVGSSYTIALTGPLETALNLGTPQGICFLSSSVCTNVDTGSYGTCTLGSSSCYNDIIIANTDATVSPGAGQYDFITAVEHETDEALGTSSCLSNETASPSIACSFNNGTQLAASAADLFRYSAHNARSFFGTSGNQANGTTAYFSINGGTTNLVNYNNSPQNGDYGDFIPNNPLSLSCTQIHTYVQDDFGCPGLSGETIENDGGVEITLLDAVGYKLTSTGVEYEENLITPEPSSLVMSLAGLGAIGLIARRRLQARA